MEGVPGRDTCVFFQAEDGIRDLTVTGVQTCALPIYAGERAMPVAAQDQQVGFLGGLDQDLCGVPVTEPNLHLGARLGGVDLNDRLVQGGRSEERRVGKECRSRWSPYH